MSKRFDVVKKEKQLSTSCWFWSLRLWSWRDEAYTIKKTLKINPFVVKSVLESNWKWLNKSATRDIFYLKPDLQMKKLIFGNDALIFTNTTKWKRSCLIFLSFMSEQCLNTRSETLMHLKNFKNFQAAAGQKKFSSTKGSTDEQLQW